MLRSLTLLQIKQILSYNAKQSCVFSTWEQTKVFDQANKNELWKIMKQYNNNSLTIPTLQTTSSAPKSHSSLDKGNKFFQDCFNQNCPTLTECSHNFEHEIPP